MIAAENIRPISDVKRRMPELIEQMATNRMPIVVTQNGEATAVVQDIKSYQETQETMALLRILAIGAEHIRTGRTKPLDEVLDQLAAGLDEAR